MGIYLGYSGRRSLVHSLGMDVFFHTCGAVYPIIGDLIEAGVDMLNLGQLNLNEPLKRLKLWEIEL